LPPKPRKEVVVVLRPYALLAKAELEPTPSLVVVCTKRFTNDAGEEDKEEELEEEETSANNPPTHANATVAAVLIVVLFFLKVPNIFVASSSFSTSSSFSSSIKGCRSKSLNLVLLPLYPRLIIVPVAAVCDDDDKDDAFSRPRDDMEELYSTCDMIGMNGENLFPSPRL